MTTLTPTLRLPLDRVVVARPAPHCLGAHRVTALCGALQMTLALATALLCQRLGFTYVWRDALPVAILIGGCVAAWLCAVWIPGRRATDWVVAESWLVLAALLLFVQLVVAAQYPLAAVGRPLVDAWLARGDALIGVHVPSVLAWTRGHPWIGAWFFATYHSFGVQLLLPVLVLGFRRRDRAALWEYAFHFHVTLVVAIASFALWPALGAYTFYGCGSLFDQSRVVQQLADLRAGVMTVIDPSAVTGLVSVPSFHTAGALMVTWAFRRLKGWLAVLLVVNAGLVAATVCAGVHYGVDVLAGVALCAFSVGLYRLCRGRLALQG